MNALVCQAIRERRIVRLHYHGGRRELEPHSYGVGRDGQELLRGYQLSGVSRSGESFGWKMFRLGDVRALTLADRTFAAPRPDYQPDDPAMDIIYCRL
jgi:hypothetical protein